MTAPAFIAADWGTSRLRLMLCDGAGQVVAREEGEGAVLPDCAGRFAAAVAPWDRAHGVLPAILCGMVGSTLGWREASYLPCPAPAAAIAGAALRFKADGRDIAIAPGLSCRNPGGAPDVMRGEETQILGALGLYPELARGRHLVCLPGTHTKWVLVEDGAVTSFQTALSGELYDLLLHHSILARGSNAADANNEAFAQGVKFARQSGGLLLHLFSTRSRQLAGEIAPADAASYLSGLVLGADVAGAMDLFAITGRVTLICAPALAALYEKVLTLYGLQSAILDGGEAVLAGLVYLHTELFL
jgi:2-dehydro-3-deoxygalactonokinase